MSENELRPPWEDESDPGTVDLYSYELVCGNEGAADDLTQKQDVSDRGLCAGQLKSWPSPPNLRKPPVSKKE